ncbi:hypothetical protein OEIGOIKO_07757 [Streptomyces chrestomyceticus JCM 4735]|uniref:Lipoprotein n=1 Tax=Streptomyces chrestomyceticus JCM 4735 TaxID=1306181 RepID=A0A7U9L2N5_9ACTN|nr:hypothetical protein [Streptomyces chrestomyceticus]GCD39900.1 hypothetical protein OEIGOIKO_07757 [Streptomyces chrestomyceticus JCM 4735]
MPFSRPRAAAALALLLATAACTATPEEPPSARPPAARPPVNRQADAVRLPLDAYGPKEADTQAVDDAKDVLMGRCMSSRGLPWRPLPRVGAQDLEPENLRRYGVADAETAGRYGYHAPPVPPSVVRRDSVWDARDSLPDAERIAAYGSTGEGGCYRTVRQQLGGGTAPLDYEVFNRLTLASLEASQRAPEVGDAMRKWSACMAQSGLRFKDALAAGGSKRWDTDEPTDAERAAARTDVACKKATRPVTVWAQAEARIQQQLIRQHAGPLKQAKDRKDRWLTAARRVLADADGGGAGSS